MNPTQQCVRCGAELSHGALMGVCQRCLLDEAQQPPAGEGLVGRKSNRFGDYEVGAQIGRGGMGVVYEAVQVSLRRPVALKMILDSNAESPIARRRFGIEAEAAAKLDHPHIVPIYDVGEYEGQPFLSMKLIAGENLRWKISSGALCLKTDGETSTRRDMRVRLAGAIRSLAAPYRRFKLRGENPTPAERRVRATVIARFMATVARAVHHAHEHGVLHRDIKPANILVDSDSQPHLTDFGLAKILDPTADGNFSKAATESGQVFGTPNYMSPEQAAGQRLSHASDTYSLGAVLYEMLAGVPPFKAPTILETLRHIAEQPPRRPSLENSRIDRDLEIICLKCLEKNPVARYPSAAALADDLERWLRQEPIRARPAGVPLRVGRWAQRNRLAAALILSLFVGLGGTTVLLDLAAKRQARLDLIRSNNLHEFNQEIETLWQDESKSFVHIRSARLAEIAGSRLRAPVPGIVTLTLATVINLDPYGQAQQHAPVLAIIEERMEELLGHPVLFDLRLYKYSRDGKYTRDGTRAPVTLGEVDFQRLGPVRYIQARQNVTGLQLLVREKPDKQGIIFARRDSGITNIAQVTGHRVAFADTNSTVSFLTKIYLARAGVTAQDLSKVGHHEVSSVPGVPLPLGHNDESDQDVYAHKEVLRRVLANHYDVGEASRHHFEMHKHRNGGLVELRSFPVISDVMVARPGLNARLVEAFGRSLCSLTSRRERTLLGRLKHGLEGYKSADDAEFNELRSMLTNELRRFESPAPSMH